MIGGDRSTVSVEFWSPEVADLEVGDLEVADLEVADPEVADPEEGPEAADPESQLNSLEADPEVWSPEADPEEESCVLGDYPRLMYFGPTANLVSSQLVACYEDTCEIYRRVDWRGKWSHLVNTRSRRIDHSSIVNGDRILLIGGVDSRSTEWIPVDGSPSQPGPFEVRHGSSHCTIQVSPNLIVVTGGYDTEEYVTEYDKLTGDTLETPLNGMKGPRYAHACAVYQAAGDQQVRRVCTFYLQSFNLDAYGGWVIIKVGGTRVTFSQNSEFCEQKLFHFEPTIQLCETIKLFELR